MADVVRGGFVTGAAIVLALISRKIISRKFLPHVPETFLMFIAGMLIGVVNGMTAAPFDGEFGLVMFNFLFPTLLWQTWYHLDYYVFRRALPQLMLMILPQIVVGTALQAAVAKFSFPEYSWDWPRSFTYGAILVTTNSTIMAALFSKMGAPTHLEIILHGESTLIFAGAIVVANFAIALDSGSLSLDLIMETVFRFWLGGIALGLITACISIKCLSYIYNDSVSEIAITVLAVFGSFGIAEQTPLKVSGLLATITVGMVASGYGKVHISHDVENALRVFWDVLYFFAEVLTLTLSGMIVLQKMSTDFIAAEIGYVLIGYVSMITVRTLMLGGIYPVVKRIGYGIRPQELTALSWGGLKGVGTLVLALGIEQGETFDAAFRERLQFQVSGITFISLLVNGSLCKSLLKYLNVGTASEQSKVLFERSTMDLDSQLEQTSQNLRGDRFLGHADWDVVWSYIPVQSVPVLRHRIAAGRVPNNPNIVPSILRQRWKKYVRLLDTDNQDDDTEDDMLRPLLERQFEQNWKPVIHHHEGISCKHNKKSSSVGSETSVLNKTESALFRAVSYFSLFRPMKMEPGLISEARRRLSKGVKNLYWKRFENGLVGHNALHLLTAAESWQYDHSDQEISQFSDILQPLFISTQNGLVRCLSKISRQWMFNSISLRYDVAATFIAVHESVAKQSLESGNYPFSRQVVKENSRQVMLARKCLNSIWDIYQDLVCAVQTQHAVRALLRTGSRLLADMKSQGRFEAWEHDCLLHDLETSFLKVQHQRPLFGGSKNSKQELQSVSQFSRLKRSQLDELWKNCKLVQFKAGDTVARANESNNVIYVILRGAVELRVIRQHETAWSLSDYGSDEDEVKSSGTLGKGGDSVFLQQTSSHQTEDVTQFKHLGPGSLCGICTAFTNFSQLEIITAQTSVKAATLDASWVLKLASMNVSFMRSLWISAGIILGAVWDEKLSEITSAQLRVALEQATMYTNLLPRRLAHRPRETQIRFDRAFTVNKGTGLLVLQGGILHMVSGELHDISAVSHFVATTPREISMKPESVVFVFEPKVVANYLTGHSHSKGSNEESEEGDAVVTVLSETNTLSDNSDASSGNLMFSRQLSSAMLVDEF